MGTERGLHFESGDNTYWAPEVLWAEGRYHMFVSCIRGVPDRWEGAQLGNSGRPETPLAVRERRFR